MSGTQIAIEQAIKLILKKTGPVGEYTKLWGSAMTAYFSPQIRVISRLFETQMKYGATVSQLDSLRAELDHYCEDMKEIYRALPEPTNIEANPTTLIKHLDCLLLGIFSLIRRTSQHILKINEFLEIDRPSDIFALVIGNRAVYSSRLRVCETARNLLDVFDALRRYRNALAMKIGRAPLLGSPSSSMEAGCESLH